MPAPDPMRLLFFASETAVLGLIAVDYTFGSQARYVEPIIPVFCLGFLGLFASSVWFRGTIPALSRLGFATLVIVLFWICFARVTVTVD